MEHIRMAKGIFYLDGKPKFLLSADYPYYRDRVENWSDRLEKLKKAHIGIISFYVPWRHHAVGSEVDFDGRLAPNKNVKLFMKLCQDKGLYVLLKPGPFIHAETDFGGLPDGVDPDCNEGIEPMLNGEGKKRSWHRTLPAPMDPIFSGMVKRWFRIVHEELVKPYQYPAGPVISLQILNEGVYSDAQHPVTEYDYSGSSLKVFRSFLNTKYGGVQGYNSIHGTEYGALEEVVPPAARKPLAREQDILPYMDWAEYQAYYMAQLYSGWGGYMDTDLPYILNLNPPHDREQGYDDWFNRLEIETFRNQHYGYTNWIGVVSHDESAFNRYLLLTKRGRGPNLEENWSFSKLYDYRYTYTAIPFFQTIMAVAGGATGYNVYTGVGTDQWDDGIDTKQEKPYPDCCPITETGGLTPKYYSMKLLNRFFQDYGDELMECETEAPVTWGIYNRYAQIGCWGLEQELVKLGRKPIRMGRQAFDRFQRAVRRHNMDYHMLNLAEGIPSVEKHPLLILVGGFFMEAKVQQNLVDYVRGGGTLLLTHDVPVVNERLQPCTLLAGALFQGLSNPSDGIYRAGKGQVVFRQENLFEDEASSEALIPLLQWIRPEIVSIESDAQVWVHRHLRKDIQYYFILGLDTKERAYKVRHKDFSVEVELPAKSSAVLRVKDGILSAGVVKGIHEFEKSYAAPSVSTFDQSLVANKPCDLYFSTDREDRIYEMASSLDNGEVMATYVKDRIAYVATLIPNHVRPVVT